MRNVNVAFWSHERDVGVTSSLLALALGSLCYHPSVRISLLENHKNRCNLGKGLFGKRLTDFEQEESNVFFVNGGTGDYLRYLTGKLKKNLVDTQLIEVVHRRLYYYWQDMNIADRLFDYQFLNEYFLILERARLPADLCFIDTKANNNLSTKEILQDAQAVVVCLPQEESSIRLFYKKYKSILNKSFFLITRYHPKNKPNIALLTKKYPFLQGRTCTLQNSDSFVEAMKDGRLLEFFNTNFTCRQNPSDTREGSESVGSCIREDSESVGSCIREDSEIIESCDWENNEAVEQCLWESEKLQKKCVHGGVKDRWRQEMDSCIDLPGFLRSLDSQDDVACFVRELESAIQLFLKFLGKSCYENTAEGRLFCCD